MLIEEIKRRYEKISPMLMLLDDRGGILSSTVILDRYCGRSLEGRLFFEEFRISDQNIRVDKQQNILSQHTERLLLVTSNFEVIGLRGELIEEIEGAYRRYFLLCAPWTSWMIDKGKRNALHISQFPLQDTQLDGLAQFFLQELELTETQGKFAQLALEKKSAEYLSLAKSDFISHASHELRTPLNGVISALRLIPGEANDFVKRRMQDIALSSALSLLDTVNGILEFSSIEQNEYYSTQRVAYSILEIIKNIEKTHSFASKQNSIFLKFDVDDNIPDFVEGDPKVLTRILHNLIGNAIKYSLSDVILVSLALRSHNLEIKVEDFGIGIKEEFHEKIFERFWVASAEGIGSSGTGLGLSIVKSLISRIGGTLKFDSAVDVGTFFEISIPTEVASARKSKTARTPRPLGLLRDNVRALLVDDNTFNLEVATLILERCGLSVVSCGSAQCAIKETSHSVFDIIFMDINMPGINGVEATSLIRENPIFENVPIIALTANAASEQHVEYIRRGLTDVLVKPISPDVLNEVLTRHLGATS
jgi:signal transduction histidine kinase/CheY-like chemotaxis protein